MVKVAVIGAGGVGTKLGSRLLKNGNAVKYGVRDVAGEKVKALQLEQPSATFGSVGDAIEWSDAIILATPSVNDDAGIQKVAASLGPNIKGKVLIDATNPLTDWPALEVRWKQGSSGGEVLAAALPDTHVFKAFNTLGADLFLVPGGETITGEQLVLLYAGPKDDKLQKVAESVIEGVGFKPKYVGPLRYARNLEAIAELWIHLAIPPVGETREEWGGNFHFQTIHRT